MSKPQISDKDSEGRNQQTHSFQQFPVIFLWPTMEVAGSNLSGQAKASFSQIAEYNQQ